MASSVFFKFKSQKEPARVTFDGTGISVFELKRAIIEINRLGNGTDFDLAIYNQDTNEEYDDDAAVIPRSTSIVARRLPPAKPGRGGAARYVSGKMPTTSVNVSRVEKSTSKVGGQSRPVHSTSGESDMAKAQTEEERIEAMFKAGAEQWDQQQQEMANATPVYRTGGAKNKPNVNVPNHPPPSGYVCYRCGEKGHWIQQCPTNNDPNFDGRPRVKRTTGIPRSFLRTIEKPASLSNDGVTDTGHQPSGVMVNADGEFVVAEPDKASWEQYQAKTKVAAVAQEVAEINHQELVDRAIQCPLDQKLFVDPMKTPCCKQTYCNDCITNSLIEEDLTCPGCHTKGVLLQDLVPDLEITARVKRYLDEKENGKQNGREGKDKSDQQLETGKADGPRSTSGPSPAPTSDPAGKEETATRTASPKQTMELATAHGENENSKPKDDGPTANDGPSRKRPADEELPDPRPSQISKVPLAKSPPSVPQPNSLANNLPLTGGPTARSYQQPASVSGPSGFPNLPVGKSQGYMAFLEGNMNGINGYMGVPVSIGSGLPTNSTMMNLPPMATQMDGYGASMNGFPGQGGMSFMQQPQRPGMYGGVFNGGQMGGGIGFMNYGQNMQQPLMGNGGPGMINMNANGNMNFPVYSVGQGGGSYGNPSYQPGANGFGAPPADDDNAYFRKPLNPHRHQARQRRLRPSDYREL